MGEMSKGCYSIVEGEEIIEGRKVKSYGVHYNGYGEREVLNISTDKKLIEDLIQMINENDLNPLQLQDVCEDILL